MLYSFILSLYSNNCLKHVLFNDKEIKTARWELPYTPYTTGWVGRSHFRRCGNEEKCYSRRESNTSSDRQSRSLVNLLSLWE